MSAADSETRIIEPWPTLKDFLDAYREMGPPAWEESILRFFEVLIQANQEVNLTRIESWEDFTLKHIADSLLLREAWPQIEESSWRVLDLGCGGGIPSIPLAITFPHLEMWAVDSVEKKVNKVQSMGESLKLKSFQTITGRGRELARKSGFTQSYDLVVARAVAEAPRLIPEIRQFLKPGGTFIAYKTPEQMAQERESVAREAEKAKMIPFESPIFQLPEGKGLRRFWIMSKQEA